jgi:hypothetical protein
MISGADPLSDQMLSRVPNSLDAVIPLGMLEQPLHGESQGSLVDYVNFPALGARRNKNTDGVCGDTLSCHSFRTNLSRRRQLVAAEISRTAVEDSFDSGGRAAGAHADRVKGREDGKNQESLISSFRTAVARQLLVMVA